MALPTLNYTTPEEFVNYYFEKLKVDLGVHDVQISKVGFIGFILNILGYTHFDVKNYYENLFIESFIATAQQEESQYLQAAIYGYLPAFATPSTAVGTIEFDFNNFISRKAPSVVKREVYLGYNTSKNRTRSTFKINPYYFTIDSTYKFVDDNGKYYVEIITGEGSKITLPSSSANIVAPLYSTSQYLVKELNFSIGKYNFGSHKTYYFSIEPEHYLSSLEVYIIPSGATTETEFGVEYVKYLAQADDEVVFLRALTSTNFMIEFGSGLRGAWVSGGFCRLVIKYTKGKSGDLIDSTNTKTNISGDLLAYDYILDSGVLIPYPTPPVIIQPPLVDFSYSNGGVNSLSGEDLRDAIINYIQTRDNLVSSKDFYNVAVKNGFFSDFKYIFKKINVFDNTFYLCRSFRDRDQDICYTTNHTQEVMSLAAPVEVTATAVAGGSLVDGTYGYFVDAVDEWGRTMISAEVTATTSGSNNSVQIDWVAVDHATGYRVYGRTPSGQSMYWDVSSSSTTFTDTGEDGTLCTPPTRASLTDLIYLPTFTIDSESFVSPFLYKGNTRMNYYEGYMLSQLLKVDFGEIIPDPSVFGSGFEIPTLYLNLSYDIATRTTTICLKSYQDIQPTGGPARVVPLGHTFSVTISVLGEAGISEQAMIWDESTSSWKYDYTEASKFGIFDDEIQIEIVGYEIDDEVPPTTMKRFTCRTEKFYQLQNISDQLKLMRYSSDGHDYLINIPVIYYDTFNSDKDYYINKIYNFINGMNFRENRMITDNVQCRFLNTYSFISPFTEAIFVQGKRMISSYDWLDDVLKILDDAPVSPKVGDRYLVSATPSGEFTGESNKIAEYTIDLEWEFITPEINDGVYDVDTGTSYVWTGIEWVVMPSIRLPFLLSVTIRVDLTYVQANSINLGVEKENLMLALANYLQKEKTGTTVKFYNSQVIDFIHTDRLWVKSVTVNVTDSTVDTPRLINNGIEVRDDSDILIALEDKLNIVKFTPPMIYWDVNNIKITLMS